MPPKRKRPPALGAKVVPQAATGAAGAGASGRGRKGKKVVTLAQDSDVVLVKCRELKTKLYNNASKTEPPKDCSEIPSGIVEVSEMDATEVLDGMENIALQIANQVLNKQGFSMAIPSRSSSNQIYIKGKTNKFRLLEMLLFICLFVYYHVIPSAIVIH